MTKADFDRVVANAKSNAAFRAQLRDNFATATAGFDLTAQERADLQAQNLGAEPTAPGAAAARAATTKGGKAPTPMESFNSKATLDKATGKWKDNITGREVSPPEAEGTQPGGTLGGRPVP